MYTKSQFFGDFIRAYGYLGPAEFRFGKLSETAVRYVDICFSVYGNAATNSLNWLLIGRIVKKNAQNVPINLTQIGYGIDDIERSNFGKTNAESPGSVLDTNVWSPPLNDAWLLGGVHAHLDFYMASPRTRANVLDPSFGTTVTGRELLGITTFGYTLAPNTRIGEVFVCTDKNLANNASFTAYQQAINSAASKGSLEKLVNEKA